MSGSREDTIKELLAPLSRGLEADGYQLEVALRPGVIDLEVVAGPEACADCLVPRELMEQMFRARLGPDATGLDHDNVTVTYPADHDG
ncbi:MAG: hypothetical protein ACFCU2_05795 [Acidimicrobiia bacterium]